MKSPSSSVGIIESDGMRNGSNRNERITSTIRMTGKNERAYSTTSGSRMFSGATPLTLAAATRCGLKNQRVDAPDQAGQQRCRDQDEREVEDHAVSTYSFLALPTCRTARNASCGISTEPTCFMRFLPSFCFSSSLRLREMSPP